jgi:hypothetical protein
MSSVNEKCGLKHYCMSLDPRSVPLCPENYLLCSVYRGSKLRKKIEVPADIYEKGIEVSQDSHGEFELRKRVEQ